MVTSVTTTMYAKLSLQRGTFKEVSKVNNEYENSDTSYILDKRSEAVNLFLK